MLLARQAAVDAADADGWTPLHLAAEAGAEAVGERLLAAVADTQARDAEGRTVLRTATVFGHDGVAGRLRRAATTR